jgi:hypothetical protein
MKMVHIGGRGPVARLAMWTGRNRVQWIYEGLLTGTVRLPV